MPSDVHSGEMRGITLARELRKSSLPDQTTLLSWLFAGRVLLATVAVIGGALGWTEQPAIAFFSAIVAFVALLLTGYGAWRSLARQRPVTPGFLQIQAVTDLVLVTWLVHALGSRASALPALYVVVIAAYAVLMPVRSGAVMAALASVLFVAVTLNDAAGGAGPETWGQIVVFTLVFTIVAVLGRRLRQAGMEQVTLEHELRRVRLEADDILRTIRSGVLTVDGGGRLAFINPTAQRLLALDESLLGRPVLDELKHRSSELWAAITSGIRYGRKVSRGEGMVTHPNGRMFPIGLSTASFERAAEAAPSVTAIFTDISDLKQLQELHLRAERSEAVAALSASLAHEIRNPLASIRSSVEQLARTPKANEDEQFLASLIVRESDRLSRLLSEFLDFSRVRATEFVPVDLHAVAVAAVRLVRANPDCHPDADLVVEGGRTMIEGDEDLLHRIVANLVLNAVQAARGAVRVVVRVGPATNGEIPHSDIENPLRIQVADTGPGIPEEIRDRLFQPFVSMRPGGSGLGLAIVQRAVEAHRGLALVDSEPGRGTTFTILLPAKMLAEDAA
jgi:two-component system, NtrC family, sensor histidine kinase PilS